MGIYHKAVQFLREVYAELKKVSWLSRKEVIATTIVVIIFMLITAAFVGIVDFILSKLLGVFLGGR